MFTDQTVSQYIPINVTNYCRRGEIMDVFFQITKTKLVTPVTVNSFNSKLSAVELLKLEGCP
jgi:hypothetical protein